MNFESGDGPGIYKPGWFSGAYGFTSARGQKMGCAFSAAVCKLQLRLALVTKLV